MLNGDIMETVNQVYPAWMKFGTILDNPKTAKEAMISAGLDYKVVKKPVFAHVGKNYFEAKSKFATVREDTKQVLGVVGSRYSIIQNVDAFGFFDMIVSRGEASYEIAGRLGNGERIWMLVRLSDNMWIQGIDEVHKYLLVINSHDGIAPIVVKFSPVRALNSAMLHASIRGVGLQVKIKHTPNTKDKFREAHRVMGSANKFFTDMSKVYHKMSTTPVSDMQIAEFVRRILPEGVGEYKTRLENSRGRMLEYIYHGDGQDMITANKTLWGLYCGIVSYADYGRVYRGGEEEKLDSMWLGSGFLFKQKAFDLALSMLN